MVAQKSNPKPPLQSFLSFLGITAATGVVLAGLGFPAVAIAGVVTSDGADIFNSLPSYMAPVELQSISHIYASDGSEIAAFYEKNRKVVASNEISPLIKEATVAVEDHGFYTHGGVNLSSIVRAFGQNLFSGGQSGGASTITQQLVKNQLIERASWANDPKAEADAADRNFGRKLREMRLAIGMEKQYTKDQILTQYLNTAFMGGRVYGIEQAAEYYFGVHAKDVTLPQAALLSGMYQQPNSYAPTNTANLKATLDRRNLVLSRMLQYKYITQSEYDKAIKTPIKTKVTPLTSGCGTAGGDAYFCDYVVNIIKNDSSFGKTPDARMELLRRGGLEIQTTLDPRLQKTAIARVNHWMPSNKPLGAASVSIKNGTGQILSMVQNKKYDDTGAHGKNVAYTAVNFNTDKSYGSSTGFQTGSTYKIFTLLDWLKTGHTLREVVDARVQRLNLANFADRCGKSVGYWSPQNVIGFKRYMTVDYATANSVNTAFLNMARRLDLCDIRDMAESFGVHRADGSELLHNPSAVIGTNEIAPLTMAAAYSGVANDGNYCTPVAILKIVDSATGKERADIPRTQCHQAVDKNVDREATVALQDVMKTSYGKLAQPNTSVPIAGKSGTTNDAVQNWMIGFTTKVTTLAWTGNYLSGRTPTSGLDFYVHGVRGDVIRQYLFKDIMAKAASLYGGTQFAKPDGPVGDSSNQVAVPDVAGMTSSVARSTLQTAGFDAVTLTREIASSYPAGTAASTNPTAGTKLARGATVWITLSKGGLIQMPNVVGQPAADAVSALKAAGFTKVSTKKESGGTEGMVKRMNVVAGDPYAPDTSIVLTIGKSGSSTPSPSSGSGSGSGNGNGGSGNG